MTEQPKSELITIKSKSGVPVEVFIPKQQMSRKEAEQCAQKYFKTTEQPNSNAMIFEQVNGSIKVTLELLEQLETKDTNEEAQKNGCIWTLKGWLDNNLRHLQKAFG